MLVSRGLPPAARSSRMISSMARMTSRSSGAASVIAGRRGAACCGSTAGCGLGGAGGGSTSLSYSSSESTWSAKWREVLHDTPMITTRLPIERRALTTWRKSESPDTSTKVPMLG